MIFFFDEAPKAQVAIAKIDKRAQHHYHQRDINKAVRNHLIPVQMATI